MTSSCAAITEVLPNPKVFTELDWNEQSIREVEEKGRNAANLAKYRASKILAERGMSHAISYAFLNQNILTLLRDLAAWDFYNKYKTSITWDLAVINPPYVRSFSSPSLSPLLTTTHIGLWCAFVPSLPSIHSAHRN